MRIRVFTWLPVVVAFGLIAPVAARQQPDRVTVPLSDPSRPALIDVSLVQGSITVRGTNRKDVLVIAHAGEDRPRRRVDADASGLRRLPQTAGAQLVAVTGYGRKEDQEKSIAAGFDQYFVKPMDTAKLVQLLAAMKPETTQ